MSQEVIGPFNPNRLTEEAFGRRVGKIGDGFAEILTPTGTQLPFPAEVLVLINQNRIHITQILAFLRENPGRFLVPSMKRMGFK